MKTHLVMPMGGAGSRFYKDGYKVPKPLIEIHGKPFLYWSTISILRYIQCYDLTFVVLKEHIERFNIDKTIYNFFPNSRIVVIDEVLPGPVYTCLEGIKYIDDDYPIIFNDCDHMFKCSQLNDILNKEELDFDGGLITFLSTKPQYSYILYKNDRIVGTVEKKVVSNHAICGAYIFRNKEIFKNMAKLYIDNCPYKETFVSGIYNVMCEEKLLIKDFLLDYHVEFGTPEEYEKAKNSLYFNENG